MWELVTLHARLGPNQGGAGDEADLCLAPAASLPLWLPASWCLVQQRREGCSEPLCHVTSFTGASTAGCCSCRCDPAAALVQAGSWGWAGGAALLWEDWQSEVLVKELAARRRRAGGLTGGGRGRRGGTTWILTWLTWKSWAPARSAGGRGRGRADGGVTGAFWGEDARCWGGGYVCVGLWAGGGAGMYECVCGGGGGGVGADA